MSFNHVIIVEPHGDHAGIMPIRASVLARLVPRVTLVTPVGSEYPELLGDAQERATVKDGPLSARTCWHLGRLLRQAQTIRALPRKVVAFFDRWAKITCVGAQMLHARSLHKHSGDSTALIMASNYIGLPTEFALLAGKRLPQIHVVHFPDRALDIEPPALLKRRWPASMPLALVVSEASNDIQTLTRAWPHLTVRIVSQAGINERPPGPCKAEARQQLHIPADRFVILLFGKWHCNKDNETVLQAVGNIPDAWLLVAGDPGINDIASLCRKHAIGPERRSLILHSIDPGDLALFYKSCDVIIVSHHATFTSDSGVLSDAVSYRRPVIATAQTYAGQRVRAAGLGLDFEAGNAESLRKAIEQVRQFPPSRSVFAHSGIDSIEQIMRTNLQLLEELRECQQALDSTL